MLSRFALLALLVGCAPTPASIKFDGEPVVTVHTLDAIATAGATVLDAEGKAIDPQPKLTWTASPNEAGKIEGDKVTPAANGDITVEAAVGEVKGSYKIHVALPDAITLSGYTVGTPLGLAGKVELKPEIKAGADVIEGQTVEWSSSDEAIATVDTAGVVTGVAAGTATITAKSGALSATQEITVAVAEVTTPGGKEMPLVEPPMGKRELKRK